MKGTSTCNDNELLISYSAWSNVPVCLSVCDMRNSPTRFNITLINNERTMLPTRCHICRCGVRYQCACGCSTHTTTEIQDLVRLDIPYPPTQHNTIQHKNNTLTQHNTTGTRWTCVRMTSTASPDYRSSTTATTTTTTQSWLSSCVRLGKCSLRIYGYVIKMLLCVVL